MAGLDPVRTAAGLVKGLLSADAAAGTLVGRMGSLFTGPKPVHIAEQHAVKVGDVR